MRKLLDALYALLNDYLTRIKNDWNQIGRAGQQELIGKATVIILLGAASVLLCLAYYFLNQQMRVFALPLILVLTWFFAQRVIRR